jgi:hypothetical protein
LKLKNVVEWNIYCRGDLPNKGKKPKDIPRSPDQVYANKGWLGFGHWLGTNRLGNQKRNFAPFTKARSYARSLKLTGTSQWEAFCKGELPFLGKLPINIPTNPNRTYAGSGWVSFGDWLGTGNLPGGIKRPSKKVKS